MSAGDNCCWTGGSSTLPGSWFFETGEGLVDDGVVDGSDEYQLTALRAALNARSVTDVVFVPSSEHVAEIVGRQGCKIKALRAKTNVYIKTPQRGESPCFVVTGKSENVAEAKREIECAAEHFTQIRASRRHSQGSHAPGHCTAYVRVPLRLVGLVVGPKGATIKRIQQDTHTYCVTPSREREPVFEITGLPSNVEAARRAIESHIYSRTGNMPITDPAQAISSFDLKAATAAATVVSEYSTKRPNYGALAAGTHEMRRQTALEELAAAQHLIQQGQSADDSTLIAKGADAYNHALAKYQQAVGAAHAAAKQLGIFNGGDPTAQTGQTTQQSRHFELASARTSPLQHGSNVIVDTSGGLLGTAALTNGSNVMQRREPSPLSPLFDLHSSAPTSTRGSSPFGGMQPLGSQSSLHHSSGSPYGTWSNGSSSGGSVNGGRCGDQFAAERCNAAYNQFLNLFNGSCGLSAKSTGSRDDEGLGESPTSSVGRLSGDPDPFHLMMRSIWSDLEPSSKATV